MGSVIILKYFTICSGPHFRENVMMCFVQLKPSNKVLFMLLYSGGWGNQRSVIRKCDQCLPKSSLHHHPLSAHEYRPFWISWEGGLIQLGNGTVPQEDQLIEWMDPEPYTVNHMGVSTGWGADGSWVFDFRTYIQSLNNLL